jgi:hypothetical protein
MDLFRPCPGSRSLLFPCVTELSANSYTVCCNYSSFSLARYQAREYNLSTDTPSVPQQLLQDLLQSELDGASRERRSGVFGNRVLCIAYGKFHVLISATGSHGMPFTSFSVLATQYHSSKEAMPGHS